MVYKQTNENEKEDEEEELI